MPSSRDERPRVVMLVRNPFTHDSRVEKEADTLRDAGFAVTIVCEWRDGLARHETRRGVDVHRVPRRFARIPILRFLSYRSDLIRAVEETEPAILHAHDANALGEVGLVAARREVPFVYDSHELWLRRTRHKHSRLYHGAMRAWHARVERRYVPRAAAVFTVSPPIATYLQKQYKLQKVDLVANYPEVDQHLERRDLRELAGEGVIPSNAPILLHIGLYGNDRGIEQVMEALTRLPDVHFVLLGAGDRAGRAKQEAAALGIAARVHPLDRVPTDQVIAYASSATIAIVPIIPNDLSYEWALPNKLFQSMAAALPVIASDLPEMGAVVRETGAGLTVNARNPDEIVGAVRNLLASPALREQMGARGRAAVLERYNWGVAAATLVEAYRRIPLPRAPALPKGGLVEGDA
ncbi:MAG: glycosyltransferase family 4 protein [Nocardioidaceae bacterium]|nr:glycosyltransferase family 4 protein [Nocardioidaceae bacterium]